MTREGLQNLQVRQARREDKSRNSGPADDRLFLLRWSAVVPRDRSGNEQLQERRRRHGGRQGHQYHHGQQRRGDDFQIQADLEDN